MLRDRNDYCLIGESAPGKHPADRIRTAGLKVSAARVAILGALEADRSHPTAEQVFEGLRTSQPSLSLSTVYKTLDAFSRVGQCRRLVGEGGGLRFDGVLVDHDHALCRACGAVYDIAPVERIRPAPPPALLEAMHVAAVRVEYEVVCPRCCSSSSEAPVERPASI